MKQYQIFKIRQNFANETEFSKTFDKTLFPEIQTKCHFFALQNIAIFVLS